MSYKFVGHGKAFPDEKLEELKNIIKEKNPDKINNIVEVGTQNGFATLLLADISEQLKSLDYPVWYGHNAHEQLAANNLQNVMLYVAEELLEEFKESIKNKPEVVYMDLDTAYGRNRGQKIPEDITPFVKELEKYQEKNNDYEKVTLIHRMNDEFVVQILEESKKTPKKRSPEKTSSKEEVSA